MIEETWRKLNKDILLSNGDNNSPFSKPFMETVMNLARIAECTYQHGDGHGAPDSRSKNRVLSLIIDPIRWYILIIPFLGIDAKYQHLSIYNLYGNWMGPA